MTDDVVELQEQLAAEINMGVQLRQVIKDLLEEAPDRRRLLYMRRIVILQRTHLWQSPLTVKS